ncbi:hypothetical protein H0A66_10455 [Alcaligenaceae bacterium]|nr:hypothetical protein [Alcaligenaceae bacterium]
MTYLTTFALVDALDDVIHADLEKLKAQGCLVSLEAFTKFVRTTTSAWLIADEAALDDSHVKSIFDDIQKELEGEYFDNSEDNE